jgi:hypothetical protein
MDPVPINRDQRGMSAEMLSQVTCHLMATEISILQFHYVVGIDGVEPDDAFVRTAYRIVEDRIARALPSEPMFCQNRLRLRRREWVAHLLGFYRISNDEWPHVVERIEEKWKELGKEMEGDEEQGVDEDEAGGEPQG